MDGFNYYFNYYFILFQFSGQNEVLVCGIFLAPLVLKIASQAEDEGKIIVKACVFILSKQ